MEAEQTEHTDGNRKIQDINLQEVALRLWKARKMIFRWCGVAFVLALIIGFSIPNRYQASVVLAPETAQNSRSNLSSLASMVGVDLNNNEESINVQMYPDIVASTPFICDLFDLPVRTKDDLETTLLDYLKNHQKKAWWSYIFGFPKTCVGWVVSWFSKDTTSGSELDILNLPKAERQIVDYLAKTINVAVATKTGKVVISLEMQDPLVAVTTLNAVLDNLKKHMDDYRTSKIRQDIDNLSGICEERKADYYKAQQAYARYMDANKNVTSLSAQAERERLQQEMNLAYQVYSQVATQLEASRIQEQQAKPVFTVLQPAVTPMQKSAPRRGIILIGLIFLAFFGTLAWEFFGKSLVNEFKKEGKR